MLTKGLKFILLVSLLSCSSKKRTDTFQPEPEFPYVMASIPNDWMASENSWFTFYLPPNWKSLEIQGLDSKIADVISEDSTLIFYFDDLGFGKILIRPSDMDGSVHLFKVDTLSNAHNIYYQPENKKTRVILHESFWMQTHDSLSDKQFEMACKVFQTVKLKREAFSESYFKDYQSGNYYVEPDHFKNRINRYASEDLAGWGFRLESEKLLANQEDYSKHWWLSIFSKRQNRVTEHFPKREDWTDIKSIRQFIFRNTWKFFIEEWQLEDERAARKWLQIAVKTKRLDNSKPPRVFWREGAKIYFVMATAARDWFEHGSELVELFSGRKRALIELFNEPIDLVKYKKSSGANSGLATQKSYHFKPDTVGTHYQYFWFHHLRPKFRQESFKGLVVHTYIHGDSIGWYNDVSEDLISIKSRLPDSRLGWLDLVGKDRGYLSDVLGLDYLSDKNLIVKAHNRDLLILHLKDEKVDWFNFVRTNIDYKSIRDLPEELRYYEERLPNYSNTMD